MARRTRVGSTNVTVRKGLVDLIEEEIVKPRYLGYVSNAEVVHDAVRLLLLVVTMLKVQTGDEVVRTELLAAFAKVRADQGGQIERS